MAVPSYTTDLSGQIITLAQDDNSWGEWSGKLGGGSAVTDNADFFIQGTLCTSAQAKSALNEYIGLGVDNAAAITWTSGWVAFIWHVLLPGNAMDLYGATNPGILGIIGTDLSTYTSWAVGGSDHGRNPYGGWQNYAVDPENTNFFEQVGGGTGTTYQWFGAATYMIAALQKGEPQGFDAMYYGRGEARIDAGEIANPGTFLGFATLNDNQSNRYGLLQSEGTGYLWKGLMTFGSVSACYFVDSNVNITIDDTPAAYATFNKIEINNVNSEISWNNITFTSVNPAGLSVGSFEMVDNATTMDMTGCVFTDMTTFIFLSNAALTVTTFRRCGLITQGEASMLGCIVAESTVGTNVGAVFYDNATDTDGVLDGMTFSKGTNAHHAIDFGTTMTGAPKNITLRDCNFNGFGAVDDSDDSTVRFLATTGTVTLSLVGCQVDGGGASESNFSVHDTAGVVVTLSIDPVTMLVTVFDDDGVLLDDARVYVRALNNSGDLPYLEDVTSITRSGTVATVTHDTHGMEAGEKVILQGITDKVGDNYGAREILASPAPTTNTYAYTTTDEGSTTYTGDIKATGVFIDDLTGDGFPTGTVSNSRTFVNPQPITGFVRKSTDSPRFKSFTLSGTIDTENGLSINVSMILDE
jgi:hypothetical protein